MARRGGCAKLGGALPKLHILYPKTAFFGPNWLRNPVKTDKRRETVHTLHVRLDCPMTISPFLPSDSTICPRNGPKMAESGRDCAHFVSTSPEIKNGLYLGLRGSTSNSQGMESTCKPPLFVVFKPQNRPTRPLDPIPVVTCWSRRAARGAHGGGHQWVHQGPRGEKNIFSKVVPGPFGMQTSVFRPF